MVHVIGSMLMTLYCVAPEDRLLKRNWKSGEGLWKTARGMKININKTVYMRFNGDGSLDGNSDINVQ